jgi:hypothetical protein
MERAGDDTGGPGNVTVDEPTEPALNPDDDDLQGADGTEKSDEESDES